MGNFALPQRLFPEDPSSGTIPEDPYSGRRCDSGRTPKYVPEERVPEEGSSGRQPSSSGKRIFRNLFIF